MQKHLYSMFNVLSSPLNHTQTNQNKVMPLTYKVDFENKKNINKYKNINIHSEMTPQHTNIANQVLNRSINKNLGWGGNRFFSLSTMRNVGGGGCGCG